MSVTLDGRVPVRKSRWWWLACSHALAMVLPVAGMLTFCAPCSGPDPSAVGNMIFVLCEGLLALAILVIGLSALVDGVWPSVRVGVFSWALALVPTLLIELPVISGFEDAIESLLCPLSVG